MTGPLVILAIGALAVGAYFQWTGDFLGRDGYRDSSCKRRCSKSCKLKPWRQSPLARRTSPWP